MLGAAAAITLMAIGIKGGFTDSWTLPQSGSGSGTGYPPPYDPCFKIRMNLGSIRSEMEELRYIIKHFQAQGFVTSGLDEDMQKLIQKERGAESALDKKCPGWRNQKY